MTLDSAAFLFFFVFLLVVSGWAGIATACRLDARGCHWLLFLAAGALAAAGMFSGILLLLTGFGSGEHERLQGLCGAVILLPYLLLFRRAKGGQEGEAVQGGAASTGTFSGLDEKEGQKRDRQRSAEEKRLARERALGMPLCDFLLERIGTHAKIWMAAEFLLLWIALSLFAFKEEPLANLIFGFTAACIFFMIYCCFIALLTFFLPFCVLALTPVLLPALISAACEAWWRIRHRRPWFLPPVDHELLLDKYDLLPDDTPPTPSGSSEGWIVPLFIGLWIGGFWGDD